MHRKLTGLGLIGRIEAALMTAPGAQEVTDLVCWVAQVDSGRLREFVIVADFRRRVSNSGGRGRWYREQAEFAVSEDRPFGPMTLGLRLTTQEVAQVCAIAGSYG